MNPTELDRLARLAGTPIPKDPAMTDQDIPLHQIELPDPCLWVRDARDKDHPHPEALRCRPDGLVWCAPCLARRAGSPQ